MEDAKNTSSITRSKASDGIRMDIKFLGIKKDVYRTFCMKQNSGPQSARIWPNGKVYS